MNDEDDFPGVRVDDDHDFANEGSHNTLLQALIGATVIPNDLEIGGETFKFFARRRADLGLMMCVLLDLEFEHAHLLEPRPQRRVPDLDRQHRVLERGERDVRPLDGCHRAVHDAVRVPALDVRHQLGGEEAPRLVLEQHEVLAHPGRAGQIQDVHDRAHASWRSEY